MKTIALEHFSNHVAILQLENLKDKERIQTYIKALPRGTVILIGEYVLDPFFSTDWLMKPHSYLKNKDKLDMLIEFCQNFQHTIITPIVQYKNKGYYKNMAILINNHVEIYTQQRLIQFQHWNEVDFFSNDVTKLPKIPFTFIANDVKFGVLFGFETHFDEFWTQFKKANVDIVLVASANTFSSHERWKNLLTTHAFTNSCYVFRANRIGQYDAPDGYKWNFYGHSFVSLGQKIIDSLESGEGMLCVEIDKKALIDLKEEWKFR